MLLHRQTSECVVQLCLRLVNLLELHPVIPLLCLGIALLWLAGLLFLFRSPAE
jgi:hypothetical protein